MNVRKGLRVIMWFFLSLYLVGEYGLQGLRSKNFKNTVEQQNLVSKNRDLLKDGKLLESGYSSLNYINFQENHISGLTKKFRFKKFDHFTLLMSNRYLINFSISNLTYIYSLNLSVSDTKTKSNKTFSFENFPILSQGPNVNFNPNDCLSYQIQKGENYVKVNKTKTNNVCQIEITFKTDILNGTTKFEIQLKKPTLHEFNKLNKEGTNWYYYIKHLNLQGTSSLKFLEQELSNQKTLVLLDYGRGIFNFKTEWYWATGSTNLPNGDIVSFNFQEGLFDESSQSCEDYFQINDKIIKLNPLYQQIDYENQSVSIKTHQNFLNQVGRQAEISFQLLVKTQLGKSYGLVKAVLDYTYGFYSGWITDETGKKVQFQNMLGLLEHPVLKW